MIQQYLLQYGFLVSLAVLALSALLIYRANFILPAILVGLSSLIMLSLKIMHEATFSQELVSYTHNEQGQVLGANIDFTIWQSASLWADPIGFLFIACGFLVLSKRLQTLNKSKHAK